jgi:hypothetical protein
VIGLGEALRSFLPIQPYPNSNSFLTHFVSLCIILIPWCFLQEVLEKLKGDQNLEGMRIEFEKLYFALTKTRDSEKRIMKKCRELNSGQALGSDWDGATAIKGGMYLFGQLWSEMF